MNTNDNFKRNILAIIPARGGSKGLPYKNIIELGGKPLISWTIESSLNSKYITKTIVSSDDDKILKIAKDNRAEILKRPSHLALDDTSTEVVIKNVLEMLKIKQQTFDYIILLQPTSPLRGTKDIDKAFDVFFNSDATALISVTEIDNKILKSFTLNESGYIEGISNNQYPFIRRQDLPKTYSSNGAIYIIKTNSFDKDNTLFTLKTIPFIMNEHSSIDIDTKRDLKKAEGLI